MRSKDVVRYPPQGRGAMMRKAVEARVAKLWRKEPAHVTDEGAVFNAYFILLAFETVQYLQRLRWLCGPHASIAVISGLYKYKNKLLLFCTSIV